MFKHCLQIVLFCLLSNYTWAAKHELNLFLWSEYIDPGIIRDFANKFDCRITLTSYEDAESMLSVIRSGGVSFYDIVLPPDHMAVTMIKSKLLAPLRHENLPNLKNVTEKFVSPPFDPGNQYTVPYLWGTVGIYVRTGSDKKVEETWGLIFDPKKQPGPFVLIDSPREMISAALRYRGNSSNSTEAKCLKQARELLINAKKRSLGFEMGAAGKNKVLHKSATAAVVYSGDGLQGMKEDPQTYYFVPQEGGRIWLDNIAILSRAPNREMAEKFLNYILDPKVGARLATFLKYATPNHASKAFLRGEDLKNKILYPPPDLMAKLDLWEDLADSAEVYDEIWKKVRVSK